MTHDTQKLGAVPGPSPRRGLALLGFEPGAARTTWTVAVVATLLYALYQARETVFIFILAVFFSYMVYPLVDVVQKHVRGRTSRTGVIGIVYIGVMACLMLALVAVGSKIVTDTTNLATSLPTLIQDPRWVERIPLPAFLDPVKPWLLGVLRDDATHLSDNALPLLREFGTQLLSYAGNAIFVILVPILSFLLSKDAPELRESVLTWLGVGTARRWWDVILTDLNVLLAGYMRALLLLSLATFVIFSLFLSLAGVPYSVLLAVLAALLEFIPMLGPLSAAAVIVVVALFSGYGHVSWLVIFLVAYRLFEDYVLSPFLMSSGVELSPLLVILGVLAGEHLGGVPAMFLSIPTIAAIKILAVRMREHEAEAPAG